MEGVLRLGINHPSFSGFSDEGRISPSESVWGNKGVELLTAEGERTPWWGRSEVDPTPRSGRTLVPQ